MIQESTIAELDPRQVKQVEAADKAALTNPSYSVEIYSAILKLSPGCLELRKKLLMHKIMRIPFAYVKNPKPG